MLETYYVGTYWLARQETAESCAKRATRFFERLSECDRSFKQWFEQADSRSEALGKEFTPVEQTFLKMFALKENQQLLGGFSIGAWNGEESSHASGLNIACGSPSHRVPDACVLTLPEEGATAERVTSVTVLTQSLRAMVLAWEPEWGIATSELHRDEFLKTAKVGMFVGWIMYFSNQRGPLPSLPAPVTVEPVEDKGYLVILTRERFTASNPKHVELAELVHERLDRSGLLKPLQPETR
ncbi:MAG TPA: immunity 52 family protein [Myxococcaceae bacterium]|jgi:hypothetical protein